MPTKNDYVGLVYTTSVISSWYEGDDSALYHAISEENPGCKGTGVSPSLAIIDYLQLSLEAMILSSVEKPELGLLPVVFPGLPPGDFANSLMTSFQEDSDCIVAEYVGDMMVPPLFKGLPAGQTLED